MGLRSRIRDWLVEHGHPVPGALVRPHDRLFHATVNRIRPGAIVLDIGANRGQTAAAFAARGAVVHAFEPNPDIYAKLEEAARRQPGIQPEMCAILDHDGEMELYLHRDYAEDALRHSESSSLIASKDNVSTDLHRTVRVRDIAGVIAGIGQPIDLVKIDAEGAEYRILARMIESGAIDRVARVHVEPHHDRIPGLRAEYDAVAATIAARGLGDKISFDWA